MLCLDVCIKIFDYCNCYDQLNIMSTCKLLFKNLKIKKLYGKKIDDNILKQEKFIDLEALDATGNDKITNINNLTKLKTLYCAYNCGIRSRKELMI